jgi:hypothetical protein
VVSCCEYFKYPLHSIKGRSFLVSWTTVRLSWITLPVRITF